MDELISKGAVIEAIEKARANVGHNLERSIGKSIIEILDDVGRDVDRLPPALGTNLAEVGTEAITKQQAIDALRKLREEDIEDYGCEIPEGFNQDHLDRATFAIKQLPPIQPEIIRCKDCKHWDGVDTCDVIDAPVWDNDFCSMAERRSDE